MTQDSMFHNGYQIGDSRYYTAQDYHQFLHTVFSGTEGYVIDNDSAAEELQVRFVSGQTVSIDIGEAIVAGVYYKNDALFNIVLEDNSAFIGTRIDLAIIRINWNTQTARVVVKRGVAALAPEIPELTQEIGNIFEFPLAMIICPDSFTGFDATHIIDMRHMLHTSRWPDDDVVPNNLMFNSEFLSTPASISNTPVESVVFPMWHSQSATFPTVTTKEKFEGQQRGRTIEVSMGSTRSIYTRIPINDSAISTWATVAFMIQVSTGTAQFSIDGGATTTYTIPATKTPLTVIYRTTYNSTKPAITFHLSSSGGAVIRLGQVVWSYGKIAPPFAPQHELILSPKNQEIVDLYNGSGVEVQAIDPNIVAPGVKNLVVLQEVSDDNSSSYDDIHVSLLSSYDAGTPAEVLTTHCGRNPDEVASYNHGIVYGALPYNSRTPSDYWALSAEFTVTGVPYWYVHVTGVEV